MAAEWRCIDDIGAPWSAAAQMDHDVRLLDEVAAGALPVLRLYTWAAPALSLGRFQDPASVDHVACERNGVSVVSRPTGGRALLHGGDLTYAVAVPRSEAGDGTVDGAYAWLAGGLIGGLARLGVEAGIATHEGDAGGACFAAARGSDLRVGTRKVCGSAQMQTRDVLLQHGSILVDRLAVDECSLLRYPSEAHRAAERKRLRESTVTLRELGVRASMAEIGDALVEGLRSALNLRFTSRAFVAGRHARR